MKDFLCDICGKRHQVYRGITKDKPEILHTIPVEEYNNRVTELLGSYIIDKEWMYNPVYILLGIKDIDPEFFHFKTWVKSHIQDFTSQLETLKQGKPIKLGGELTTKNPLFPSSEGSKIVLSITMNEPLIVQFYSVEDALLQAAIDNPMSKEDMIVLYQKGIYHSLPQSIQDSRPFNKRLIDVLVKTEIDYLSKGFPFVIDLVHNASILIQIVGSNMMSHTVGDKNRFTIYIPFDTSSKEIADDLSRFKRFYLSNQFTLTILDDIPTYTYAIEDKNELVNISRTLLSEFYGSTLNEVSVDAGPV